MRFPFDRLLPLDLIDRIVRFRAEQNRGRVEAKAGRATQGGRCGGRQSRVAFQKRSRRNAARRISVQVTTALTRNAASVTSAW